MISVLFQIRPDTVVINKETKNCQIFDLAKAGDATISAKQEEEVKIYQNLSSRRNPLILQMLGYGYLSSFEHSVPYLMLNRYLKEIMELRQE